MPCDEQGNQCKRRQQVLQRNVHVERGFGVILLLRRVWDAMAAHQQPMRIDRIRRTSDERDQILAGLNCQLFGIGRQNGSDLIDLIRIRVFKYCDVELVAFFHKVQVREQFCRGQAPVARQRRMRGRATNWQ